jgi:hypothetical protein
VLTTTNLTAGREKEREKERQRDNFARKVVILRMWFSVSSMKAEQLFFDQPKLSSANCFLSHAPHSEQLPLISASGETLFSRSASGTYLS